VGRLGVVFAGIFNAHKTGEAMGERNIDREDQRRRHAQVRLISPYSLGPGMHGLIAVGSRPCLERRREKRSGAGTDTNDMTLDAVDMAHPPKFHGTV
jgi:hypothetical protein